jgi:nitrogen fixation/metabolism regulation signal transduction histidine kinase
LLRRNNESLQLSVRCTILNLKEEEVKLITLQDIRGELERKELDSWVKLIKVLNHEIMNSLAPVTSIAQSLKEIWESKAMVTDSIHSGNVEISRTINGLDVIVERGEALMRFVESYRLFTRMPELHRSEVSLQALFDRLSILVSPMKEQYGVSIRFVAPEPDFLVKLDEQVMVQVIINLVKNGAEAVTDNQNGLVEICCSKSVNGEQTEITVSDNGPGIPSEIADEIFVPFFTTKNSGSGIGLSYSRQILRAHGGTINCYSKPGNTVFTVRW